MKVRELRDILENAVAPDEADVVILDADTEWLLDLLHCSVDKKGRLVLRSDYGSVVAE